MQVTFLRTSTVAYADTTPAVAKPTWITWWSKTLQSFYWLSKYFLSSCKIWSVCKVNFELGPQTGRETCTVGFLAFNEGFNSTFLFCIKNPMVHAVKLPIFCPLDALMHLLLWSFAATLITSLVSVRKKCWWGGRLLEGRVFVEEQPLCLAAWTLFHGRDQCWHILNLHKRQLSGYLKISFLIESHLFRKHKFTKF